ncbi:TolC family protein [Pectobacterium brasiliense]|uniref:TolC family protein n=1 Tax=Pectobacterium brasiliense TaxID=180957 RepID=UPI0001A42C63|nr:TolC family protein [Pectobacterium brasiliense]KGA25467.1 transporter [Pectobacterium brasiliense]KMK84540.1 outer membrane efflux protein [Pectobacterium brasiliense ICMP 19477]KRF59351.1 transporter [Pectobacterium brasiliense]MBN3186591.1 TolC family protein [Pectobacterium brasiliense]MBN3190297.1 TolC family protein [Pectobacterium brasiliense]
MLKGRKLFSLSAIVLAASGCAVTTQPISKVESGQRSQQDQVAMFSQQEPVTAPITLYDAMARALKYNLESRLKVMEYALSQQQLELARYDMLPRIAASAGYVGRNNMSASSSRSVETGRTSLEPSTSQDRDRDVADLTMVWNVLDFGVSYVTAQQKSDQRWIAEERKRKVVHTILQDVRSAYWRAVAAERLLGQIDGLIARVNTARDASEHMSSQQIGDPIEALSYQRALIDATRQLEEQRRALSLAKTELATLMNLPLDTAYKLALPQSGDETVPQLNVDVKVLEEAALVSRPELREQDYQVRIHAAETRKALLRMLPGVEISAGGHYDSNSFLVNNSWADVGVKATWNLFNLLSGPAARKAAQANESVSEMQRQAMSLAIMAQLYIARANFNEAQRQYKTSSELRNLDTKIVEQLRNRYKANSIGELQLIQGELNALNASLRQDLAYAELRNTYGQIFSTIGLDLLPKTLPSTNLADISQALRQSDTNWQQGKISTLQSF